MLESMDRQKAEIKMLRAQLKERKEETNLAQEVQTLKDEVGPIASPLCSNLLPSCGLRSWSLQLEKVTANLALAEANAEESQSAASRADQCETSVKLATEKLTSWEGQQPTRDTLRSFIEVRCCFGSGALNKVARAAT